MMGRQSGQISMLILDIEEMIPENHLLRKINQLVSFDFIHDIAAPYYPDNGRSSVDPVSMFKMLLVGYLYGIKSERRLVQEVQLNIAYCKNRYPSPICTRFEHHLAGVLAPLPRTEATKPYNWFSTAKL